MHGRLSEEEESWELEECGLSSDVGTRHRAGRLQSLHPGTYAFQPLYLSPTLSRMPKHLPSFKHLLSTSSTPSRAADKPDKSVNQLIAASRSNDASSSSLGRDAPPHPHTPSDPSGRNRIERVWVPDAAELSVLVACGMRGEVPVHPAELLRRSELARRQASRSVAGPVPPPSWRASTGARPSQATSGTGPALLASSSRSVTKQDLIQARQLFGSYAGSREGVISGAPKLVEYCLSAVLLHLESTEVIYEDNDDEADLGDPGRRGGRSMTIGEAMREQVGYLDPHLKIALLDLVSIRPESASLRLSDKSIRAILHRPEEDHGPEWDNIDPLSRPRTEGEADEDDWTTIPSAPPEIHYLPLILHPNPLPILRQLSSFPSLALTSLNLAYSSTKDLEKLIVALPASLRELSLVGLRFTGMEMKKKDDELWHRGLALLGRRMMVLRILDLSFPSVHFSPAMLGTLLGPETHLPSLITLGLRGILPVDSAEKDLRQTYKAALDKLRTTRKRWIDVVLE